MICDWGDDERSIVPRENERLPAFGLFFPSLFILPSNFPTARMGLFYFNCERYVAFGLRRAPCVYGDAWLARFPLSQRIV